MQGKPSTYLGKNNIPALDHCIEAFKAIGEDAKIRVLIQVDQEFDPNAQALEQPARDKVVWRWTFSHKDPMNKEEKRVFRSGNKWKFQVLGVDFKGNGKQSSEKERRTFVRMALLFKCSWSSGPRNPVEQTLSFGFFPRKEMPNMFQTCLWSSLRPFAQRQ